MDENILLQLRNILVDRRLRAVQGFEREREGANDAELLSQTELIDMAQTLEQIDRDTSLHEQERTRLTQIDRALSKMAGGTFGHCEDCEEEIPVKRLLIVPEARLCAKCQAIEERHQSRTRGFPTAAAR